MKDLKDIFKDHASDVNAAIEFGEYRALYLSSIINHVNIIDSLVNITAQNKDILPHLEQIKKDVDAFIKHEEYPEQTKSIYENLKASQRILEKVNIRLSEVEQDLTKAREEINKL